MAHVDPLIAHRPEFADTLPDLRPLTESTKQHPALAAAKREAKPFLLGAAVGASVGFTIAVLTVKKAPRPFALFPEPKSVLVKTIVRAALIAAGRAALRRAFVKTLAAPSTRAA